MNLKEYLSEKRKLLEPFILDYLKSKRGSNSNLAYLDDAIEKLEKFVTQGKMLRGILVLASCEMFGREISNQELQIAAALELTHSALLIHDDIMDNDLKRRGNPTIFAQYISQATQVSDPKTYGISQGINVGDISLFYAYDLLSNSTNDVKLNRKLVKFFTEELVKVGAAQMQDVAFGYSSENPNTEDILSVYKYKSGRYTVSLPLVMGAILTNQDNDTIKKLDKFGEKLGIIFQIKDDELGLFGNEAEIGKPVGSDIRENKKTIFRSLLFQKADSKQMNFLNTVFGNGQLTQEEIVRVKKLLSELNVVDEVNQAIQELLLDVRSILSNLDISKSSKSLLEEFIEYNLNRSV